MRRPIPILALLALTACGGPDPAVAPLEPPRIESDAEGRCHGQAITPAVIETETVQELDTAEVRDAEGRLVTPATYRSVVRQRIRRERQVVRFETLCPPAYTPAFVASLQRALATRGYYDGPANGVMDAALGRAVQDFQRADGPDSDLLSLASARRLGLVALSRDQIERLSGS